MNVEVDRSRHQEEGLCVPSVRAVGCVSGLSVPLARKLCVSCPW